MTINLQGVERYQSHQQLGQSENARTGEAQKAGSAADTARVAEDAVSLSDEVAIVEWIARQSPDLADRQAAVPANLGRLSDHLLRYNLVSLPEAGRLMSLAGSENDEVASTEPLNGRIRFHAGTSETWLEKQQWQKLDRVVSNLSAAQSILGAY